MRQSDRLFSQYITFCIHIIPHLRYCVLKYSGLFAIVFLHGMSLDGQTVSRNNNSWLHQVATFRLSKHWGLGFESTYRLTEGFRTRQQWFVRPCLDYYASEKLIVTLGYSRYTTYAYGKPAMNFRPVPEDHVWLQLTHKHKVNDMRFTNRLRNENRWVGMPFSFYDSANQKTGTGISGFEYRNRLRYMFIFQKEILKKNGNPVVELVAGDEVFLNLGSYSGKTIMNQNRVIAGFQYNLNTSHKLQVTYIHQNVWNFQNTILESNPTIRLTWIYNPAVCFRPAS